MEEIIAKSILQNVSYKAGWFGVDYNMNLYRGCCHGCIYCDSRSSCYGIDHFDTVRIKKDALLILENELRRKRVKGIVGMGAMSDTYIPFEKELKLSRQALMLLDRYGFGLSLETKSDLILRDLDILKSISEHNSAIVKMTITCADDNLAKLIEPNVCPSSKRFEALQAMNKAGIYAGILLMPLLPFINDTSENITAIVKQAKEHKIPFIYPMFGVTLRDNQRDYYLKKADELFPGTAQKMIHAFGSSYNCQVPNARRLYAIFKSACDEAGILYKMSDIIHAYQRKTVEQLHLHL